MRGQGYDGAAAMSGKLNGAQAHIREIIPTAFYVHCAAHSLNLAMSNSCDLPPIRNCMGTIASVYNFFNAPKRQNVLRSTITTILPTTESHRLVQVCATRWVDRHESVSVFSNLQHAVVEALGEISTWPDKETASRALQLLSTIRQSEFCIALLVLKKIFGYSVVLCKVLQKKSLNLLEAVNIAEDIAKELKSVRENAEHEFHQLYSCAQETAEAQNFTLEVPRRTLEVSELKLWYRKLSRLNVAKKATDALNSIKECCPDAFPNIFTLITILLTLPVTTCTSERSFSTLRRLKTYLRNTTGTTRMNGLALQNIYRAHSPCPGDVIDRFSDSSRRLNISL